MPTNLITHITPAPTLSNTETLQIKQKSKKDQIDRQTKTKLKQTKNIFNQ